MRRGRRAVANQQGAQPPAAPAMAQQANPIPPAPPAPALNGGAPPVGPGVIAGGGGAAYPHIIAQERIRSFESQLKAVPAFDPTALKAQAEITSEWLRFKQAWNRLPHLNTIPDEYLRSALRRKLGAEPETVIQWDRAGLTLQDAFGMLAKVYLKPISIAQWNNITMSAYETPTAFLHRIQENLARLEGNPEPSPEYIFFRGLMNRSEYADVAKETKTWYDDQTALHGAPSLQEMFAQFTERQRAHDRFWNAPTASHTINEIHETEYYYPAQGVNAVANHFSPHSRPRPESSAGGEGGRPRSVYEELRSLREEIGHAFKRSEQDSQQLRQAFTSELNGFRAQVQSDLDKINEELHTVKSDIGRMKNWKGHGSFKKRSAPQDTAPSSGGPAKKTKTGETTVAHTEQSEN